ncbi:hypothetical protein V8F20_005927 [Naviculisporaceae sp. PSN 640]
MATLSIYRTAFHRTAVPLGLSLGAGFALASHQRQHLRFDAIPTTSTTYAPVSTRGYASEPQKRKDRLDAEVVRQLSSGSISGFVTGLLVSVFSKTLVLLLGISIFLNQIAKRYGLDLVHTLRLRKYLETSRIMAALRNKTAFKLSFGFCFAMSAFMSF